MQSERGSFHSVLHECSSASRKPASSTHLAVRLSCEAACPAQARSRHAPPGAAPLQVPERARARVMSDGIGHLFPLTLGLSTPNQTALCRTCAPHQAAQPPAAQ